MSIHVQLILPGIKGFAAFLMLGSFGWLFESGIPTTSGHQVLDVESGGGNLAAGKLSTS